jgi:hypothetical protein
MGQGVVSALPSETPVFCLFDREGSVTLIYHEACSLQHLTKAITKALSNVDIDEAQFQVRHQRPSQGGLSSTAIEAEVPEWALVQSGWHGQPKAAPAY